MTSFQKPEDKIMEKPYVESAKHPLAAIKAYIALAGAVATALLGVFASDTQIGQVLTVVAVIATAVATYKFPNAEVAPIGGDPSETYDDGYDPEAVDAPDTPLVPTSPEYEDTEVDLVEEEPIYEEVPAEPDDEFTFTEDDFGHGEPEQR